MTPARAQQGRDQVLTKGEIVRELGKMLKVPGVVDGLAGLDRLMPHSRSGVDVLERMTRTALVKMCVRHGLWNDLQERVGMTRALRARGVDVPDDLSSVQLTRVELVALGVRHGVDFNRVDWR